MKRPATLTAACVAVLAAAGPLAAQRDSATVTIHAAQALDGRGAVIRQLMVESVLLAVIGGAAGAVQFAEPVETGDGTAACEPFGDALEVVAEEREIVHFHPC